MSLKEKAWDIIKSEARRLYENIQYPFSSNKDGDYFETYLAAMVMEYFLGDVLDIENPCNAEYIFEHARVIRQVLSYTLYNDEIELLDMIIEFKKLCQGGE